MNLLTRDQLDNAAEGDLVDTLRAISERLDLLDEAAILVAAEDVLVINGVSDIVRLTFGVEEWDEGYFYSDLEKAETRCGREAALPDSLLAAVESALHEHLTTLSRNGPTLGRRATISIDLSNNTVNRR